MNYYCNPINVPYRYQFNKDPRVGALQISREAADPSMILFQGRYYVFASMTLGVWVSDDLAHWEAHKLPEELPLYDYAPDVRVMGDYVYLCASKRNDACAHYRTRDILNGPYEEVSKEFPFWDPNMFVDDDGRVYFYWGCGNTDPIYGVELDPDTMMKKGDPVGLLAGDPFTKGYERVGDNNSILPKSKEECAIMAEAYLKKKGSSMEQIPESVRPLLLGMFSGAPYIEGAWMDKHNGRYYLQYACPGTQYNTYGDGVYVSDSPLGSFELADNNPYSYMPGGFFTGAGHGSSMEDLQGNFWHISTMRISKNHIFERRVGLWKAGFDADGELFCNQRYGDWPISVSGGKEDPWADPDWYLLSYQKKVIASSSCEGKGPELVVNENNRDWWRAADNGPQWIEIDLGEAMEVHAVQVNFADDHIEMDPPGEIRGGEQPRYIEERDLPCRYILKASADGENYDVLIDASLQTIDLSHDFYFAEEGKFYRFVRLEILEVPYGLAPCISGLRVFGIGNGVKPQVPDYLAERIGKLDMKVTINSIDAGGCNILWGSAPDKLYHSWLTYDKEVTIGALVEGRNYYVRVDAFNENGITEGKLQKV